MKKSIVIIFQVFLILVSGKIVSQPGTPTTQTAWDVWSCGSNTLMQQNLTADNSIQTVFDQFKYSVNAIINSTTAINTPTAPYTIPVVFHIIKDAYNTTPIPTYAQVQWQLATLNAAFSNNLASLNNITAGSHAVNTQIQFCFAKLVQTTTTPTSWPTSSVGVINYTTSNTSLLSNVVVTNTTSLQNLATLTNYTLNFPPNMYLNIWCVPNITPLSSGYNISDPPSIIGFASAPWMNGPIDGIVMRNDVIGNNTYNNFTMYSVLNKGNILAHEAGHYLGLFHTFETIISGSLATAGSSVVNCYGSSSVTAYTDGDLVFDTPPTLINSNVGPGPMNSCAETYSPFGALQDENDQLENFMSYTDDDYMNTFSLEQAARMWAALGGTPSTFLTGQRNNLVTSTNLTATGVNTSPSCGPGVLTSTFTSHVVGASITCSSVAVQFNTPILSNYLSATSFTWNFGDGGTSNSSSPVHTYTLPPLNFTVQLTVSDGTSTSTSSLVINIPNGTPKIVGFTGSAFPVCRGSEQTIFIEFPALATSAVLTDGTNYYTINNNVVHSCSTPAGIYRYPFTFSVTSSVTFDLVPANCGTVSTGIASFTVLDCCSNLITNGDFESGNTGFYSSYILNTTATGVGYAAINYPALTAFPQMANTIGLTGKSLVLDSYGYYPYTTCYVPGAQKLIIGQGFSGLKPNTAYYLSFKGRQSEDSIAACGPSKFKFKLYSSSTGVISDHNMVPSTLPTYTCRVGTPGNSALQIFNYTVTTPSTISTSTSFSLEILEIDQFGPGGQAFDDLFDNIILCEMNPPIILSPLVSTICSGTVQLNVSSNCRDVNYYTLSWQPNSSLSCSNCANPVASPSVTTIYTLLAIPPITNPTTPNIVLTATVFVATPGVPYFSATTVTGTPVLTGPYALANSFTIQSSASLFLAGEIVIAPNVSITVKSGANLNIVGAHLYSCADMWSGIVVESGGKVLAQNYGGTDNLIEDAITAISVENNTNSTSTTLDISNTVFNKNRISVDISNYTVSPTSPFVFVNDVFTCRDFSFTSTSWPQTSTVSPGLRAYTTPSPNLGTPYLLQGASIVNLKKPYNTDRSHVAIQLNKVGYTTGSSYPSAFVGFNLTSTSQGNFLLFDSHEYFITALNGNVKVNNCVFQNTQTFSASSTQTVGAAITHSTNIVHNFQLDLSSPSPTLGNQFYDCHKGIFSDNVFDFQLENAIFSSTQSSTAISNTCTGQQAVFINTKQADKYNIKKNRFTNIQSGVTINFYPGPVNANMGIAYGTWSVWPQTTYINSVSINSNTFSPELSTTFSGTTNSYVRNAVVLASPFQNYIYTACSCNSVSINDNLIYRVFNGIRLDGLNTYTMSCRNSGLGKAIANNTITLTDDFVSNKQCGIEFTRSHSYPTIYNQKVQTIERNFIKVYSVSGGTTALSNPSVSLIYLEDNGAITGNGISYPTPHILCNELSDANRGFAFWGYNKPASWRGNKMQDLLYAMGLYSIGVIGSQGDGNNPIDNQWNSSWTNYNCTWVDLISNANNSPLFVQSSSLPWAPSNNGGFAVVTDLYSSLNGNITTTASGAYSCVSSNYTLMNAPLPKSGDYPTDELLYIAKIFAYRYIAINDSLKNADGDLVNFYNDLDGSSIDKFTEAELKINDGNFSGAETTLSSLDVSDFNQVESNYFNFYTLYLKYLEGADPFTSDDITALKNLADLCPANNGSSVYQSRALYQLVSGEVYNGPDNCGESGARMANTKNSAQGKVGDIWNVDLYPNPAQNHLSIVSTNRNEILEIEVRDLMGRTILAQRVKTNEFIANLDLALINGAYFITISNSIHETVTKKLLISK